MLNCCLNYEEIKLEIDHQFEWFKKIYPTCDPSCIHVSRMIYDLFIDEGVDDDEITVSYEHGDPYSDSCLCYRGIELYADMEQADGFITIY